jgi:hypothetical protein
MKGNPAEPKHIYARRSHVRLVVYVRSSPSEYGARQLARKMWANTLRCYGAIVLFAVARSPDAAIMQMMHVSSLHTKYVFLVLVFLVFFWRSPSTIFVIFQLESGIFGDLLVFDYMDSYFRLSIKSKLISDYHVRRFAGVHSKLRNASLIFIFVGTRNWCTKSKVKAKLGNTYHRIFLMFCSFFFL